MRKITQGIIRATAVGAISLCAVSTGHAQIMNADALRTFVGSGSNLQHSAGTFIADVCEQLGAGGEGSLTSAQSSILGACNAISDEAAAILGQQGTLSEAELLTIIEAVAPEEVGAIASGFTDTSMSQLADISSRLEFLRTGVATNVAAMQWSNGMTGGAAGDGFSKLGVYINGNTGFGDKDSTAQERGFDYDSFGLTVGADYRFQDDMVAGVALSYIESDVDFDNNGGDTQSDGIQLTFYGSYYMGDVYFDGVLGFGQHDYDSTRKINSTMSGVGTQSIDSSTDADSMHLSLGAGYALSQGEWSHTVFTRLDHVSVDVDGYTETGSVLAMTVGDQDVDSTQIILGGQTSTSRSSKWGVWAPYVGLEWRFELDDETRAVTAGYAFDELGTTFTFNSDDSDSNYGLLSLGSNFVLAQGMQIFVNYDYVIGLEDVTANTLTAGIRFEL